MKRPTRRALIAPLGEFGQILIDARQLNGWSQRELGRRLNISQQDVSRYERARYRTASLRRLVRIAGALGLGVVIRAER